jgi:large subunit ribosomal protein L15
MRHKTPYKKRKKRLGCGIGSGHGKTSTKGHKGQRARSGFALNPGFEGGQNPLYRRLPKRGFNRSAFKKVYAIVNLQTLAKLEDKEITPEILLSKNVIKELHDGLKVLGSGESQKGVTIKAHFFSASAKTKIEAKGGQAILLEK